MNDNDDNFANAPTTISELKSDRTGNAHHMKPRDAVLSVLRAIDNGEFPNIDAVVICIRENKGEGMTKVSYKNSSPDYQTSIGLLHTVGFMIHMDGNE